MASTLSILERAKLFVKLYYETKFISEEKLIKKLKFKKQKNLMINEQTLPSKNQLINILKNELHLNYSFFDC